MNRLCIFAHYDRDNLIDEYVMYYLENLKSVSNHLLFVTTSQIDTDAIARLKTICSDVIVRNNRGYDFVSWQTGLARLSNLGNFDELLICNDSVYGPFYPLQGIVDSMTNNDCDFWGMTQSYAIAYHLQSYFLAFKRKVFQSKVFTDFWDSVQVENNKRDIIKKYEVGLTQTLLSAGFKSATYAPFLLSNTKMLTIMARAALRKPARAINKIFMVLRKKDKITFKGVNASILSWKELIVNCRMPFLKIELLRDNPIRVNTSGCENIIKKYTNYDITLIRNHLERMKRKPAS
jgi:lipopolysaccharide biosynthesis protein